MLEKIWKKLESDHISISEISSYIHSKYTTFIVQLYHNKTGEDPITRVISLSENKNVECQFKSYACMC